jgi:hypothetical protein
MSFEATCDLNAVIADFSYAVLTLAEDKSSAGRNSSADEGPDQTANYSPLLPSRQRQESERESEAHGPVFRWRKPFSFLAGWPLVSFFQ